jgi:hypothetical protein
MPRAAIANTIRPKNRLRILAAPTVLIQQPGDDVTPLIPIVPLELPDIKPLVVVEPIHGVTATLGAGMPINGLTPALFISVAPRGITPPSSLAVEFASGFESGDAVPNGETTPDDGTEQPLEDVIPVPPPSNDDVVPVVPETAPVPDAAPPAIPDEVVPIPVEDEVLPTQPELLDIGPIGVGPMPPGSIEVAPSGIPVGEGDDVEPRVPSGDVAPSPGVVMTLCAKPGSQPKRIAVATMNNRRICTPLSCPKRPGRSCQARQGRACCLFEIAPGGGRLRGR